MPTTGINCYVWRPKRKSSSSIWTTWVDRLMTISRCRSTWKCWISGATLVLLASLLTFWPTTVHDWNKSSSREECRLQSWWMTFKGTYKATRTACWMTIWILMGYSCAPSLASWRRLHAVSWIKDDYKTTKASLLEPSLPKRITLMKR